jgi:hypothetical protein
LSEDSAVDPTLHPRGSERVRMSTDCAVAVERFRGKHAA